MATPDSSKCHGTDSVTRLASYALFAFAFLVAFAFFAGNVRA